MTIWTPDAVLSLAPDSGSAKSAQGLAHAKQWQGLGRDELALWGEISGSGAKPYQTRIDLREPAFKCSCPSRKFPCKHGLALLLIFAGDAAAFTAGSAPAWVAEWFASREQRSEKRAEKIAGAAPVDPQAKAQRIEKREERIDGGLAQLQIWLGDLLRIGIANAKSQPPSFWEAMQARLVDAQAPGLARLVGQLESIAQSGPGWDSRLLHAIARLELIGAAYRRRAQLPAALHEEVRNAIGWARSQEELAAQPSIIDHWRVLGIALDSDERVKSRRTWLQGRQSNRTALLLDFAVGAKPLEAALPVGCEFAAELVFYPGSAQQRAAPRSRDGHPQGSNAPLLGSPSISQALRTYAEALGNTPWLERFPMSLQAVRVALRPQADGQLFAALIDREQNSIALPPRFSAAWHLLSVSGGETIDVFGEWDGDFLTPLAFACGANMFSLGGGTLVRSLSIA